MAIEASRERLFLHIGHEFGNQLRVCDPGRSSGEGVGHGWREAQKLQALGHVRGSLPRSRRDFLDGVGAVLALAAIFSMV